GEVVEAVTRFGTLKINRSEIDNLAELGLAVAPAAAGDPLTDGLEIITTQNPDGVVRIDYYSAGQKTGTQYFSSSGLLLRAEGTVKDGDYREYFPDGKVKREKTVIDGRNNGASRAYYPDGTLQSEVYFINGKMNGAFKFYDRSGQLLQERSYIDGVANGYFREFNEDGSVKSRIFYVDGVPEGARPAAKPAPPAPVAPPVQVPSRALPAPVAPARPVEKSYGILGKEETFFLTPELFTIGGANKKWEENFNNVMDYLGYYFDYAYGEMKTSPGYGVTAGVNFGAYKDSPGYIALSYIKGPSAEGDITIADSTYGPGYYNEKIETTYLRFVGGYKFVATLEGNSHAFVDLSGGFGRGKIEDNWTGSSYSGYSSGSSSESWGGITWSAGIGMGWESTSAIFEMGVRYSQFPKLKDSDTFSDVNWTPFSLNLSLIF
ncbi:MAG: toxin-antitoxin system YwqK family antitoxin, partial [Elusimicrobiales bacterium]|nr:toxin-antitoxin system YwqK family antitoxin [Elusimicrobiales bacterium]